jgi:geranylgeranyl diphosphate synthase type II
VENLLPAACALECIHTYSLIHDDLPAMDNDELRRGQPTSHILHGEAGAILAGDGLLTLAFELLTDPNISSLSAEKRLEMAYVIARASGSFGMVGGQALDIAHENKDFPFEMLKTIHRNKTGALIIASIHCGAIGCNADADQTEALLEYGRHLGLAFQIVDDLLDATSTTAELGKKAGSDQILGKATYPAYFGIEKTRKKAEKAVSSARKSIAHFTSNAEPLRLLADYIYERSY